MASLRSPRVIVLSSVLLVLVGSLHLIVGDMVFTGDETRYVDASVATWLGHSLSSVLLAGRHG